MSGVDVPACRRTVLNLLDVAMVVICCGHNAQVRVYLWATRNDDDGGDEDSRIDADVRIGVLVCGVDDKHESAHRLW